MPTQPFKGARCARPQDFELTLDIDKLVAGANGEEGAKVDIDYEEFRVILA